MGMYIRPGFGADLYCKLLFLCVEVGHFKTPIYINSGIKGGSIVTLLIRVFGIMAVILMAVGCASRGPGTLESDRASYNSAASESWKTQGLANIVRLRYSDWPSFLQVEQVIASYQWEVTGATKSVIRRPWGGDTDQLEPLVSGKYSERPSILYRPLSGRLFSRTMLTPARPAVLFALIQAGSAADRLLSVALESINGFANIAVEQDLVMPAQEPFIRFVSLIRELQERNAVTARINADSPGLETVSLEFFPERTNEALAAELDAVKRLLGLDWTEYR